jgi:hypothetical protein
MNEVHPPKDTGPIQKSEFFSLFASSAQMLPDDAVGRTVTIFSDVGLLR